MWLWRSVLCVSAVWSLALDSNIIQSSKEATLQSSEQTVRAVCFFSVALMWNVVSVLSGFAKCVTSSSCFTSLLCRFGIKNFTLFFFI